VEAAVALSGTQLMGRRLRIDFAAQTGGDRGGGARRSEGGRAPSSYSPGGKTFAGRASGPKPEGCTTVRFWLVEGGDGREGWGEREKRGEGKREGTKVGQRERARDIETESARKRERERLKGRGGAQVFCGNLAFEADEGVVREAFAAAGEVCRSPPPHRHLWAPLVEGVLRSKGRRQRARGRPPPSPPHTPLRPSSHRVASQLKVWSRKGKSTEGVVGKVSELKV